MTTKTKVDTFTRSYIDCAFWASLDDDNVPFEDNYDHRDLATDALAAIVEDCKDFQESQAGLLEEAYKIGHYDVDQAGHDFWLTRNRHGAGFWDHGLDEVGRRLTDAAHVYGNSDLYVGDDGKVYIS